MILRLILGDQLNYRHSWFTAPANPDVIYHVAEMRQETDYVTHHIQKVTGFFGAMFNFVKYLQKKGHRVVYYQLQSPENTHNLIDNITQLFHQHSITQFEYMEPDEWRLDQQLAQFCKSATIQTRMVSTEHFITSRTEMAQLFGKKQFLMETFYRQMRKKWNVLMDSDQPAGNQWNYDAENRKKWNGSPALPPFPSPTLDVTEIVQQIQQAGVKTIGRIDAQKFTWPLTRKASLEVLHHFLKHQLPHFGAYQDAMTDRDWLLFHSRLSFSLNTKMLSPLEVVQAAEQYWRANPNQVSLPQVEGFIRQILGWREYMRGIYWAKMPEFAMLNYFDHQRPLPTFFWTGDTKMKCMQHAINQSLEHAYAHHIQRLMVTGAFGMLAGIHPDAMDTWYLGIYMDAIEWVEITNTRGMSQFADGGIVGTKPYAGSANYIHKMSDYCGKCAYNKDSRHAENACPFNALYWEFHIRHADKLRKNPRIGMVYRNIDRMEDTEIEAIKNRARWIYDHLDRL